MNKDFFGINAPSFYIFAPFFFFFFFRSNREQKSVESVLKLLLVISIQTKYENDKYASLALHPFRKKTNQIQMTRLWATFFGCTLKTTSEAA